MKKLTVFSIISCIISTHLFAIQDANSTVQTVRTLDTKRDLHKKDSHKKKKESRYDKFERIFSDYDGNFLKDMFIYPFDMMMPDEVIKAAKDVINHREDRGYDKNDKDIAKEVTTDAYNFFLTTGYYYIQDITRITRRVWNKSICSPDTFIYDNKRNPHLNLTLKAHDKEARGVTENGIVLPYNVNFPDAEYPYASRPNGCSTEELEFVYDLSNSFSDDDTWISQACDEHDKCYSTIGATYKECNEKFVVDTIDSCNEISTRNTVLFLGSKNAFCAFKAAAIATGANSCAKKYFDKAQKKQKAYNIWVKTYEDAYNNIQNTYKK